MSTGRDRDSLLTSALERSRRMTEHDDELQRLVPLGESRERLLAEARSSIECLARACELYAERTCFAEARPSASDDLDEILAGGERNQGNFADGAWVQETINAAERSFHERRWVDLPLEQ